MRRVFVVVLSVALAVAGLIASPSIGETVPEGCEGRLCAGVGKADITPPIGTPLWGYSARAFYSEPERWSEQRTSQVDTDAYAKAAFLRSEGIHTRLLARAVVLRNAGGRTVALVQTDLGGITGELHRAVAHEIEALGIPRDNLLLSATHTHGGPGTIQQAPAHGLLVGDFFDPRTFGAVKDGIVESVRQAVDRVAPARAAIGTGDLLDASANRAFGPFNLNPCPDPDALDIGYPCADDSRDPYAIDPHVTVLRVDRTDGTPLGLWSSFAAHGTMLSAGDMRFSGDNQGFAERMIEQGIADRAGVAPDDVVAAYANGNEGDQTPVGDGHNRFAAAEDSGRRQARAVLAAWEALGDDLGDDLALDARWDWIYMTGQDGTSPIAVLGADGGCPDPALAVMPGQGSKCPFVVLSGTGPQWFPLQVLRIDNVAMASYPGEMTVQMGRRIRKRILDSPHNQGQVSSAIMVGLANDYMGYTTTPEEYAAQEYEGTFTLWGPEQGNVLRERFGTLADRLLAGEPNPDFVEPPATSALQAPNRSLSEVTDHSTTAVDPAPGTAVALSTETVRRGDVASFTWVGGSPSAEGRGPSASLERFDGEAWVQIADEAGYETLLDHWKDGTVDRYAVQWDVTLDATAGEYRFVATGDAYEASAYEVVSPAFTVAPSDGLVVTAAGRSGGRVVVRADNPAPATGDMETCNAAKEPGTVCPNFRWRASSPSSGTVTATIDGVGYSGAYDASVGGYVVDLAAPPGAIITVDAGALTDGHGNTNATAFAGTL